VRLLEDSYLSVLFSCIVNMVEVLGSGVNITAVSSLGGVHVASVLA
jgi:hypothetical protein